MKRIHVNLSVSNIDQSRRFYTTLFGADPTVDKPDYAKWMLDDPRVNLSITTRGSHKGIDHLGIQVEHPDELGAVSSRLQTAGLGVIDQGETTCCYAHSEKSWVSDPDGVRWETFRTTGESPVYGSGTELAVLDSACCQTPGGSAANSCCSTNAEVRL